jgi:hypothetical protein
MSMDNGKEGYEQDAAIQNRLSSSIMMLGSRRLSHSDLL